MSCSCVIMHVVHVGDDKPCLIDLQIDGSNVLFRLMDQLRPKFTRVAIALGFQQYDISTIEKKDDPMFYL